MRAISSSALQWLAAVTWFWQVALILSLEEGKSSSTRCQLVQLSHMMVCNGWNWEEEGLVRIRTPIMHPPLNLRADRIRQGICPVIETKLQCLECRSMKRRRIYLLQEVFSVITLKTESLHHASSDPNGSPLLKLDQIFVRKSVGLQMNSYHFWTAMHRQPDTIVG